MKATAFTTPSLRVRRYVCACVYACVTSSAPWFPSLTFPSGPMCLQSVGGYSETLYNICEGLGKRKLNLSGLGTRPHYLFEGSFCPAVSPYPLPVCLSTF